MRILVTNDDGVHAPGLAVLERDRASLSDDVYVVAPETDQSGVAHSLSLNDPLRLRKITERRYAVKGTPTDCVIMGVRRIIDGARPDVVLSGVNSRPECRRGRHLFRNRRRRDGGRDSAHPSIALSQAYAGVHGRPMIEWDFVEKHAVPLIRKILAAGIRRAGSSTSTFPPARPTRSRGSPSAVRAAATRSSCGSSSGGTVAASRISG